MGSVTCSRISAVSVDVDWSKMVQWRECGMRGGMREDVTK